MPRASHETTIARQWELLRMLPTRRPGKTSRELRDELEAAGHPVTKRTVERDLDELSRIFPVASNDIAKPFGWYWNSKSRFDLPGMDLTEALSLGLLEDILRQLMPPSFLDVLEGRFRQARDKLAALPENPFTGWSEFVRHVPPGPAFVPPAVAPAVLETVQEALLRRRQLRVSYASAGSGEVKELSLHPLALIQQGVRSYLLAATFRYGTPVFYAIHRIREAALMDEPAVRPEGFTLDDFLGRGGGQFGEGKSLALKARVTPELAAILRETPLSPDQTIRCRAGQHHLSATVRDTWQLHFWLLSQGSGITVMKPAALRNAVLSQLQAALQNYNSPNP